MDVKTNHTELQNKTIAELVREDFRKANVFKKHGIDFCCGGKRTLAEVCENKGMDLEQLEEELRNAEFNGGGTQPLNFNEWEMDFLCDYIVNVHHKYVKENIAPLLEYTMKVARVHGETNPEVLEIARLFHALAEELNQHIMKEEQILFPYIKQLAEAERNQQSFQTPPFGSVENPIAMMEHEHDNAGNILKEIHSLSNDFQFPLHACNTWRVSYLKLNEFEEDLHTHMHLENNILFPKAVAAERKLSG